MQLESGSALLHYRLAEKIGEGGMGIVWKATDTTLDREVAIKVLPESLADEVATLARFEREARLLASLNHPNIATVHGLHEADGIRFLAMELVRGEDLAERLARGAPPLAESLQVALQIARALEAAHDSGVIHRDLKPANVRLTPDGAVKVLDFGLAKALDEAAPARGIDSSLSPTLTSLGTMGGVILGTAAYMSPEQAAGQAVDKRCDIWSFGVVLYELLTGGRLFKGETVSHTLADVLRAEIDWDRLAADLPAPLRRIVRRCLDRNPARRLRDVGEARVVLEDLVAGRSDPAEEPTLTGARSISPVPSRLPWGIAAAAGLAAVVGFALLATHDESPAPAVGRFALSSPYIGTTRSGDGRLIEITPDGRLVIMTGASGGDDVLFLRHLDSFDVQPVRATTAARLPFISPDGSELGYITSRQLWKINLGGGPPIRLGEVGGFPTSVTWAPDGYIYGNGGGLWRLPASGGEYEVVLANEQISGRVETVSRLPRQGVLLVSTAPTSADGSRRDSHLHVLDTESGKLSDLGLQGADPRYLASGHLLYTADDSVIAVAFDLDRLRPVGQPIAVLDRVSIDSGIMQLAVSEDGLLTYLPAQPGSSSRLVRVDRGGVARPVLNSPLPYPYPNDPRFSPDGTKLVTTNAAGPIWMLDLESETPTRISENGFYPVWSNDGSTLYYGSTRGSSFDLYRRRVDMSSPEELLLDRDQNLRIGDMAPGNRLIFRVEVPGKGMDLMLWPDLDDPASIVPLLDGPADELSPEVSPDGRWLAYVSNQSGRDEVYVTSFPEPRGHVQLSVAGGTSPAWAPDSRELFYFEEERFIAVELETASGLRVAKRETLFSGRYFQYRWQRQYDVHPGGDGFVMVENPASNDAEIVVNWFSELERLVPGAR